MLSLPDDVRSRFKDVKMNHKCSWDAKNPRWKSLWPKKHQTRIVANQARRLGHLRYRRVRRRNFVEALGTLWLDGPDSMNEHGTWRRLPVDQKWEQVKYFHILSEKPSTISWYGYSDSEWGHTRVPRDTCNCSLFRLLAYSAFLLKFPLCNLRSRVAASSNSTM